MSGPERIPGAPLPGETSEAWFRRVMGEMPTPVAEAEAPAAQGAKGKHALALLERTIPQAYRWAQFDAVELRERVHAASVPMAAALCAEPRVCLMGVSRAGKTTLGVAMLGRLTGIAVKMACALDSVHADRKLQQLIEMARATWLVSSGAPLRQNPSLARLRREAELRFIRAHHAYSVVRGHVRRGLS
jgi:hypothetical protein